jgi:hypothetical protein
MGVCALFCSPLCQHIDRQPQPAKNDYHNWKYLIIPMPTTIALLLALLVSFATLARADCKDTGKPVWSKQVLDIVADCETRIISPDRRTILIMKSDGDLGISDARGKSLKAIGYRVEPPAMASWSPDSKAFFINDGEGSGMASTFRLFRIHRAHVTRDDSLHQVAVRRFRRTIVCPSTAVDPNVYGFGWSADGKQVFILVQATVDRSCGPQGTFIVLVASVTDGSVIEQLTEKQTKKRFGSLLFPELFQDN